MDKLSVKNIRIRLKKKEFEKKIEAEGKSKIKIPFEGKRESKSDSLNEVKAAPFRPEQVTKAYSHSEKPRRFEPPLSSRQVKIIKNYVCIIDKPHSYQLTGRNIFM